MAGDIETDVLVVGAGPTGLTVANYLGLNGVRTLVVERNESTVPEPRAVSIDDESLRNMQAIGLIEEVKSKIVLGYGARYYSPGKREFARIKPTAMDYGYPRRSAFRQPELEAILREGLKRFPVVDIRFGHECEGFTQDGGGVTGSVRGPAGETIRVRARFLAACDGGRSSIRKAVGAELKGSSFEERWLVFDMVGDSDDTPDSIAYCDHRRPAITLPGPDHTRRWEFLLLPGESAEEFVTDEKIEDLLTPFGGHGPAEIVRRIVYTFHARVADKWSDGRVFLLGDAAHLTPPYAGQGMNSGQRDAANFAWKAAAVVNGKLPLGVLDSYESERRDHAWSLIQMAIQIGWVMVPRNWFHTYGQILFFRVVGVVPRLRNYFLQMKFKPEPRFRRGFQCPDGVSPRRTLVGRMLPQPVVVGGDGAECKLDDVFGTGFALLSLGLDPGEVAALDQPFWQRLAARRVALIAAGASSRECDGAQDGICIVADRDGWLATRFIHYRGKILLVRPDRYVAAAFAPNQAARIAEELERRAEGRNRH